ncbi:MAG TPA: amidase [Candidatus Binatia bacterium]|jgi:aspartyl-tRNA(Asn)/glutamyl-tRNA(Gln) amidotransferase subunit A|nr:amidase [Candidatus Binatia bacterium]
MSDLAYRPAHEIAAAVRRRELSPVEVMEATLARIAAVNPTLNAFVALRAEAAMADARALGERIARGEDPGPLAGVPFGVKDEESLQGLATTYGSVPFRENVATRDSTQVARLRRAGAIPVGKTNMPEFGSTAFTKNHLFGVTRNPWNLSRTPGGSSGGSSAAVAAGMVPIATGGDGGGSIRIPASYTGLVGIKATFGRISRGPLSVRDWVDTISRGPLTRCVTDTALCLDAVAGYDPHDPDSLAHAGPSYIDGLERVPSGLRLAYSPTLGYARVDPEVRTLVERAIEVVGRTLGRPVERVADRFTDVGFAWATLNSFQTFGRLAPLVEQHRGEWGRGFLKGISFGSAIGAADVARCQDERRQLIDEMAALFARCDVLLTPTVPSVAFPAGGPMPSEIDGERLTSPIHAVAFSYPFNMTGHPAITLRCGLTAAQMPVGLQIVTERGREDLLLQVARAYERECPADEWPREPRPGA